MFFSQKNSGKVFCVGFNKTGTTSLHQYFKTLGLKSTHNTEWPRHSSGEDVGRYYAKHTCYSDGSKCDFENLDKQLPGSVFILNKRALKPWLYSRIKHVLRRGHPDDRGGVPKNSGGMARSFFEDEAKALDAWIIRRKTYHDAVRAYFAGRSNFLEIDITTEDDWWTEIAEFLDENSLRFRRKPRETKTNTRAVVTHGTDHVQGYYRLADERIEAMRALHGDIEE